MILPKVNLTPIFYKSQFYFWQLWYKPAIIILNSNPGQTEIRSKFQIKVKLDWGKSFAGLGKHACKERSEWKERRLQIARFFFFFFFIKGSRYTPTFLRCYSRKLNLRPLKRETRACATALSPRFNLRIFIQVMFGWGVSGGVSHLLHL